MGGKEIEDLAEKLSPRERWEELGRRLHGIKVIYTDLDGTMLGPGGNFFLNVKREYTLRPASALLSALRGGVDVVMVSGRSRFQLMENARVLGLQNYIAELGVQLVYGQGEEVVVNTGSFEVEGGDLYRAIVETGAVDFLLRRYAGRLEFHTPWSEHRECTPLFRGLLDVEEVNSLLEDFHPPLAVVDNGVLPRGSPTLEVKEVHAYHLVPQGVNKGTGVAEDMRRRGFGKEEAAAVGDSAADLQFAPLVGVFFLVRNGLFLDPAMAPRLQEHDNLVVTEGFLNEGWAEAVELLVGGGTSP